MFFRKKHTRGVGADYSRVNADIHSHLLPGIDDGSPDIETSVQLITGMKRLGYKKLITTPHIMWDVYKNTRDIILGKLQEVKDRLANEQVDIEIHAAAEYFIDELFGGISGTKGTFIMFWQQFGFGRILHGESAI